MIGEIYKYKRINKIEFKKNNSAGHIIIDNSKVESAISKKNIPLNVYNRQINKTYPII